MRTPFHLFPGQSFRDTGRGWAKAESPAPQHPCVMVTPGRPLFIVSSPRETVGRDGADKRSRFCPTQFWVKVPWPDFSHSLLLFTYGVTHFPPDLGEGAVRC